MVKKLEVKSVHLNGTAAITGLNHRGESDPHIKFNFGDHELSLQKKKNFFVTTSWHFFSFMHELCSLV